MYNTGDKPVSVLCSDRQQYICKYTRPNATIAYKLCCEYMGAIFAEAWKIETPPFAIVDIRPEHWISVNAQHSLSSPAIGFKKMESVIDITPTTNRQVVANKSTLYQLLKIALFDFWVANEDRTINNANLLYNIEKDHFISIDYGGILNNVSFNIPLSQLTETDSILCADVFTHINKSVYGKQLTEAVQKLEKDYRICLINSKRHLSTLNQMPREWNIPSDKLTTKIMELFSISWTEATWKNFIECLKANSNYGK